MGIPFTVAEEILDYADVPAQPQTGCVEIRVTGSIDERRLGDALAIAIALHPMARASKAIGRRGLRPPEWELSEASRLSTANVIRVCAVEDDDQLIDVRDHFVNEQIHLSEPPPLRLLLVRRPGGDTLMFKWHHAMADGIGGIRFLRSITRAYAGAADPVPDVDPVLTRDAVVTDELPSLADGERPPKATRVRDIPSLIAPDGSPEGAGYGVVQYVLDGSAIDLRDLRMRRASTSANDVLIGALHLAIADWNRQHDEVAGRIIVLMPVSLRPAAWLRDVVANVVGHGVVTTTADQRRDRFALMEEVSRQAHYLRAHSAGALLQRRPWLRRVAPLLLLILGRPIFSRRRQAAAMMSNVGRVRSFGELGPAGHVVGFDGSMPAPMPPGLAIAVARYSDSIRIGLRYHRQLFDRAAAERFLRLYVDEIRHLCTGVPGETVRCSIGVEPAASHDGSAETLQEQEVIT